MDKEGYPWRHDINAQIEQLTNNVDHLAKSVDRLARNQLILTRAIVIVIGLWIGLFIVT